jgi:hypothetical protein
MTINISPDPRLQFFGNDGKPLVGGKLYTYAAGTTTLLATYTDYTGSTANTNPVILNSRGEASVWLGNVTRYKFVLKDSNDVEIWTQDNLIASVGADGSGAYGTWPVSISGTAATATYATTAGSVVAGGAVNKIIAGTNVNISPTNGVGDVTINATSSGTVSSINATGAYGFSVSGGPITSTGTFTVVPPTPGTSGNVMVSNGSSWVSSSVLSGGAAKAWANFDGTSSTIRGSYNVSSVVRNSQGDYTVNFTTALSNSNYSCVSTCQVMGAETRAASDLGYAGLSTTSANVRCSGNSALRDSSIVCVLVYGN